MAAALKIALCRVITFTEWLAEHQTRHCEGPGVPYTSGAKPCSPHFVVEGTKAQRVQQLTRSDVVNVSAPDSAPRCVCLQSLCPFHSLMSLHLFTLHLSCCG